LSNSPPRLPRREGGLEEASAEVPVAQGGELGLAGGVEEGQEMLALVAGGLRGGRRGRFLAVVQPREGGGILDQHGPRVALLQDVLGEGRVEDRDLGIERPQARFLGLPESGAGAHEVLVALLDQPEGFGIEPEREAIPVHGLDAGEQGAVEEDAIPVLGEAGGHLLLDGLQAGRGDGVVEVREQALDPGESLAGALQGHHGVLESRGRLRVRDGLGLLQFRRHGDLVGRTEVFLPDAVEPGEMERKRTFAKDGVVGGAHGGFGWGGPGRARDQESEGKSNGDGDAAEAPGTEQEELHAGDSAPPTASPRDASAWPEARFRIQDSGFRGPGDVADRFWASPPDSGSNRPRVSA
jgi:hypothetical protein